MAIDEKINLLMERVKNKVPHAGRRQKIALYSAGLKEKLREAEFSLTNLKAYETQDIATTSDTDENFEIDANVHFYCDCFWAFLYASLDVLAQVINQTNKLELSEKKVSFKNIGEKLPQNSKLRNCLNRIKNSNTYKNLDKYRNCSLHRRHIFFEEVKISVSRSAGYRISTTGRSESETIRYLCDDPFKLVPKVSQKREVGEYCEKTYNKITELLAKILDLILD